MRYEIYCFIAGRIEVEKIIRGAFSEERGCMTGRGCIKGRGFYRERAFIEGEVVTGDAIGVAAEGDHE